MSQSTPVVLIAVVIRPPTRLPPAMSGQDPGSAAGGLYHSAFEAVKPKVHGGTSVLARRQGVFSRIFASA